MTKRTTSTIAQLVRDLRNERVTMTLRYPLSGFRTVSLIRTTWPNDHCPLRAWTADNGDESYDVAAQKRGMSNWRIDAIICGADDVRFEDDVTPSERIKRLYRHARRARRMLMTLVASRKAVTVR